MSLLPLPPMRGPEDVAAIERAGIDAFLPAPSPYLLVRRAALARPDHPAFRFLESGQDTAPRTVTFGALLDGMNRAANLLHRLGLRPGRSVVTLMPNLPETHFLAWGGCAAGMVAPINHYLEAPLIGRMIDALGAEILVIHGPGRDFPGWAKLPVIRAHAPRLKTILRAGPGPELPDVLDLDRELASVPGHALDGPAPIDPQATALLFHTGGTTGAPKFVPQSHFRQALAAIVAAYTMDLEPADRVVCGMPLFHCGGLVGSGLAALSQGATVVQLSANGYRDPSILPNLWKIVERERLTILIGPPTVYGALCERPIDADISSLRHATSSAAGMPVAVLERFQSHAGIRIDEAYGVTESTLLITAVPPDGPPRPGTVGIRAPFAELAVMRQDSEGAFCAADEIGRVVTRGPMVFDGYAGQSGGKSPRLADGWLDTGDLGRLDAEGFLTITGRSKDIIIRGGHNIDPALIEGPLSRHPAIDLCAAVGRPDAHVGEVPIAYVVLKRSEDCDTAELMRFAREQIEERAAVPKEIILVDKLPLTAVGKVSKLDLRLDAVRRAVRDLLAGLDGIVEIAANSHPTMGTEVRLSVAHAEAAITARKLLEPFTFGVTVEDVGGTPKSRPSVGEVG